MLYNVRAMRARVKKKVSATFESLAIIDIGSARVSGILVPNWPETKGEISLSAPWQDKPDWERFRLGIEQTFKKVLKHLAKEAGKRPPVEVVVFLASPFFVGQAGLVRAKHDRAVEITPPYLSDLVEQSFVDNAELASSDLTIIEDEIMAVKLDGYEADQVIGQTAKKIDLAVWRSGSPATWLQYWEELVRAEFPQAEIRWQSFTYSAYSVFNQFLPDRDWVLLDTGNELTDVLVIKDGRLAEHLTFPQGKNHLIRAVAEALGTVPAEAESLLNRNLSNQANGARAERLKKILAEIGQTWSSELAKALKKVLQTTILPEIFYLFGDEPSDQIFAEFIEQGKFTAVTASRKPLKVFYAEKPLTKAFRLVAGSKGKISPPSENSFLLAEAIFCAKIRGSKLDVWPFNQLATTMQDIIKNKKKSLRDIFPESKSPAGEKASAEPEINFKTTGYAPVAMRLRTGKLGWPAKLVTGLMAVALLGAITFAISGALAKVTVKITPKQGRLMISNVYEAVKSGETGLKFATASNLQTEEHLTLPATGTETVKLKAKGLITIFNDFSSQPQTLIAQTRFETKDGLIYRIEKQIIVPGQTKNSQGKTVPGQIEVPVVADQAGPAYNLTTAEFTIPGFKGTARFDKFSAKTKGAITGGFAGQRPKVSEEDLAKARAELKTKLLATAAEKLAPQVPDDYIFFKDAVMMDLKEEVSVNPAQPDQADLKLSATITGIMFNKQALASHLAKQLLPEYQGEPLTITNWPDFKFSFLEDSQPTSAQTEKIKFKLDGTGKLVWDFDQVALREQLQTVDLKDYESVFRENFPTIQSAQIRFSPPWVRRIPSDPEKVKIEVIIDQS